MEVLLKAENEKPKLKVALFDFDGTISTLRHGWEKIMEPMMLEMIAGTTPVNEKLINEVRDYIDQSTGIQTYYQMQWLADTVKRHGRNPGASDDPWWYKAEYNRRIMELVEKRKQSILLREKSASEFLICGIEELLKVLRQCGIDIYVASGTDHPDVIMEADILGLSKYFKEIAGAHIGKADCSKEAVLRRLVNKNGLKGNEVIVIGDGRVEIALGREVGALTLGVASDEEKLSGINPVKRVKLEKAGAHAIAGDFNDLNAIKKWLDI